MNLKDDSFYSITETLKIVEWNSRKLQRYAKKNNIRKIDNRYLFTGYDIKRIIEITDNKSEKLRQVRDNDTKNIESSIMDKLQKELDNCKQKIDVLEQENAVLKSKILDNVPHQEKLKKAIELITIEAMKQGVQHKVFSDEEYQDLIGTISEVDFQKEQVQYLRSRVEKQDEILNKLVKQSSDTIAEKRERNFIEAKEKDLHKK